MHAIKASEPHRHTHLTSLSEASGGKRSFPATLPQHKLPCVSNTHVLVCIFYGA